MSRDTEIAAFYLVELTHLFESAPEEEADGRNGTARLRSAMTESPHRSSS